MNVICSIGFLIATKLIPLFQCHPDLFPDNEKKTKEFQELQEAYSILSDTKKKAEYTQMERAAQTQAYGNPMPKHPFTGHAGMPPRNNSFGNR